MLKQAVAQVSAAMSDDTTVISDLPLSVLSLFFQHLGPIDLLSCSGVSTVWRQQADTSPRWKDLFHRSWRYWERSKYQDALDAGRYKQAFEMRAKVDRVADDELARLPEPLSRLEAINKLVALGDDAKDCIFKAAASRGDLTIGAQHWGQHALRLCTAAWCGARITTLLSEGDADLDCLHPALLLGEALHPAADNSAVLQRVEVLAEELRRRLAAEAAQPDSLEALKLLSQLLFGSRPGGFAGPEAAGGLGPPPPPGAGLQLSGNSQRYHDADNSLLHRVFATGKGIPISLSVVHAAVGRRAGMRIQYIGSSGHFLTTMDTADQGERFIDSFNGGKIKTRQEACLGLEMSVLPGFQQSLVPAPAQQVLRRMAMNLLRVFLNARQLEDARTVLELLVRFAPDGGTSRFDLAQVCLALGDPDAALARLTDLVEEHQRDPGAVDAGIYQHVLPMASRALRERDHLAQEAATIRRRTTAVRFRVGDIIQHRRYHYCGIVYGWTPTCEATDQWIHQMNVDALPCGQTQPFYNVLVDERQRPSGQTTYVAQENITVIGRNPAQGPVIVHPQLGEHFDGIEHGSSRFTPNRYRRSLYPDD